MIDEAVGAALDTTLWGIRQTLRVSPVPIALAIRQLFWVSGAHTARLLLQGAPSDVVRLADVPYGHGKGEVLDLYLPPDADGRHLPCLVWVHGGAFVGGSKEELEGYLRRIAVTGWAVAAPAYGLAPGTTYPEPLRQVAAAIHHLRSDGHIDPTRIALGGDSAGAQIAAQVAAMAIDPALGHDVGAPVGLPAQHLIGLVLCCGAFDLAMRPDPRLAPFIDAVGWAYSGTKQYREDERFVGQTTIAHHVSDRFPPTFITVGSADPLAPQTLDLVDELQAQGVAVDAVLFPDGRAELGHECQFDLSLPEAQEVLSRLSAFLDRVA